MGKIFLLLLSFQIVQGQVIEPSNTKSTQVLFDYHTTMQKKKKTTAWILLGSGVAMTIGGFAALENDTKTLINGLITGKRTRTGGSTFLIVGGGATALASIPFFISASKHKRKVTISLKGEQNVGTNIKIDNSNYLVLNVTILF